MTLPPRLVSLAGWLASPSARWRRLDLAIALVVALVAGLWGVSFWTTWSARGGKGEFYQHYFEPAVMIACGKGFVISERQPQVLEDFLWQRRDAMSCADLPADLTVGRKYIYQEAWTYLQWTVGLSWRVLGISWSQMGPLFGVLFGLVVALAYGIFRFGMGPALAVAAAAGVMISPTHLANLPHLRDYAKAPFTLALVLIIGWLVTRPLQRRTVLACSCLYGLVLGVGYGFRTDFLINVPLLVIVLFFFTSGGLTRNLALKAAATLLFLLTFVGVSWPASSAVYQKGGCQWHVALLGLQPPFDTNLGMLPAPYDLGYVYADGYIERVVNGYAARRQPGSAPMVFCSHEYDVQSGGYLRDIALTFPADLTARAYGSALQIAELPFEDPSAPLSDWASGIYLLRARVLHRMGDGWGFYFAVAAVLGVAANHLRLGLCLAFLLAYFFGYPAIQFQTRHYFHLEFMTWWAIGFVAQHAMVTAWMLRNGWPDGRALVRPALQAATFAVAAIVLTVGVLQLARWYQSGEVRQLAQRYLSAPKIPLAAPAAPLDGPPGAWPQLLEVQLDHAACGASPAVTFLYDKAAADGDFTREMAVGYRGGSGITRVFLPVFERYAGVTVTPDRPGCLAGVSRVSDLTPFPILLGAVLPPDWESRPLYQRIAAWEGDRP